MDSNPRAIILVRARLPVSEVVGRLLITAHSAILTNLILGENVVPEFLQRDCTAEKLSQALLPLLTDTPQRRRQTEAFARLDAVMDIGQGAPSERAATVVLACAARHNQPPREAVASARSPS